MKCSDWVQLAAIGVAVFGVLSSAFIGWRSAKISARAALITFYIHRRSIHEKEGKGQDDKKIKAFDFKQEKCAQWLEKALGIPDPPNDETRPNG